MEKITQVNGERIRWSSTLLGLDLAQVAVEAHIPEKTLIEVLEGRGGLTFIQLQNLAKFFGRGVLFYLEPGPADEERIFTPQFRTLANQKPNLTPKVRALIQRVERQRDVFIRLREELGEPVTGMATPPRLPLNDPGRAGEIVRAWLALEGNHDFESYRAAVEHKGILVFRTNGYNGAWQIPKVDPIEGFCLYDEQCPVIVVRKQAAEARQTFTLFHELGHLLLDGNSFIDDEADLNQHFGAEHAANAFAGRLLVPEALLRGPAWERPPPEVAEFETWLQPLRRQLGVSTEMLLRRLLDLNVLSQVQYAGYRDWKNAQTFEEGEGGNRQFRHREPVHVFGQRFARTVLDAMEQRRITTVKASRYLDNLKISDLRKLELHLASL
ncbi:MAG: ImmA/IrrE family metallo-endopeptidase [Fimbriimonas sp.]